jgi:RimJ/RimL family protein N-acetyltransferase
MLYDWVNDISVRANSLNTEKISITEHFAWFNSKINSENTKIFILTDYYKSYIGQIRVDKVDEYFEIDYSISNLYRGRGFGNKIVQLLLNELGCVNFLAKVKRENIASKKIFINNGFTLHLEIEDLEIYTKKCIDE